MTALLKEKVIVGMSGGVDSSVSALLLKKQGFQVAGLFMKNWEEDKANDCPQQEDLLVAESVCNHLDIPLHVVNFSKEYWHHVFSHFLAEYRLGRTPNPDILCNREIKFKVFLNHALSLGASKIATGHYARIHNINSNFILQKAQDPQKDQSYFLYTLSQQALKQSIFPLGNLNKTEVRKMAFEAGFSNYQKKDSTGICFIGERKFQKFLSQYLPIEKGPIETPEGKYIGEHLGLMYYTHGQRQGLNIGGKTKTLNLPWYVLDKDLKRNALIVGQGEHPLLYKNMLKAKDLHWVAGDAPGKEFSCTAKIRYRQHDAPCSVIIDNQTQACEVKFMDSQRAITPGQSIVFYQNDVCLGGGIIQ